MANEIMDPREQGIRGLRGLKGINSTTLSPEALQFIQASKLPTAYISKMYTPQMEQDVGLQLANMGVGASSYDKDITRMDEAMDVNEYRGQVQPWYSQLANGALKMLTTAGTTIADNTLGLLVGAVQGIANLADDNPDTGFWSGVWNNDFTNAMADIQEKMEEIAPNYMTNWEQNAAFYERMFSGAGAANFWGNDILKNAGFTIGSAASLMLMGGVGNAMKIGNLFKGASNLGKFSKWAANTFISTIGESSLEALNTYRDNKKVMENNLSARNYKLSQDIQAEFEDNLASGMSQEDALSIYNYKMQQLDKDAKLYREKQEAELINASNAVLAANIATLAVSNNLTLGSLIRGGYGNAKSLLERAVKTVDGKAVESTATKDIAKGLLNGTLKFDAPEIKAGAAKVAGHWALTSTQEGLEEGIQNMASTTAQMNTQAKMNQWARENSSLGSMINPDADEALADVTKAIGAAYESQFGSANGQGWTEVAAGFITGALGVAGVHRNAQGKIRPTWQGGIKESYETIYGERNAIQEQIDKLNTALTSGKFGERAKNAAQNLAIKAKQDKALENQDIREFKNAETEQLVNDALYARDMGLLDSYLEMFNQLADGVSDEDVKQLRALASNQEGGSAIDGLTNDEVKQRYSEKARTTKSKIQKALEEYDRANEQYGNQFSEENRREAIREITYQNTLLWDTYRRMEDIDKDIQELQQKKDKNTITVAEENELTTKKKAYTNLQKQANNLQKQLNEIKNSPKKLDDYITKLKDRRAKVQQYKEAQNAINKYKEATTLGEISEIYALSPEDTREQTLNNAIAQTEDAEIKQNLIQFRDYVSDVGAMETLIQNKFPVDNIENLENLTPKEQQQVLKNLSLQRVFSQILNEIVDDMLNDETPSLNRQTLKERLLERVKEFEEDAKQAKEQAKGVKYLEDVHQFDTQEANDNGELGEDDYIKKLDDEGNSIIVLSERGQAMQQAALNEHRLNELVNNLNNIINDMDKIDEIKKAAKKTSKKDTVKKAPKVKKETEEDDGIEGSTGEEEGETETEEEKGESEEESEETKEFRKKENLKQYFVDKLKTINKVRDDQKMADPQKKAYIKKVLNTILSDLNKHNIDFEKLPDSIKSSLRATAKRYKLLKEFDDKVKTPGSKKKSTKKSKNTDDKKDKPKGKAPTFDNTNESQIRDSQVSLNGNQFPQYVGSELKQGNAIRNTTSEQQVWFTEHNLDFQSLLDNYISKVFNKYKDKKASERPPVYYIHNNDSAVNKLVFIAFKYEDVKDIIPNNSNIITAQDGTQYILIGTLGSDNTYRPETTAMFDNIYSNIYEEHQAYIDNPSKSQKLKLVEINKAGGKKSVNITEDTFSLDELNNGDSFLGPLNIEYQLLDSYVENGQKRYLIYYDGQKVSITSDKDSLLGLNPKVNKIVYEKQGTTNSEWFVDTKHTNRLKDISDGVLAKRLETDEKQQIWDLRDLLASQQRNPDDLTEDSLQFVIVESTQDRYINYNPDEQRHYEVVKDADDRAAKTGRVYVYGRSAKDMLVPIYLETLYLRDLDGTNIDTPLLNDIRNMVSVLADPNIPMEKKGSVIGQLSETLLFTPYVNNIHLNDEDSQYYPNTIAITHNGISKVIIDFNKQTTLEDNINALDQALILLNPRINIKASILEENPNYYLQSGVLRTNIASLHTVGLNTYLYPVNTDLDFVENKPFKRDYTPDGNTRQRKYLNGKAYYYDGNKFFNNTGEEITDESVIEELNIIYKINNSNPERIKLDNVMYYKINGDYYVSNGKGGFEKASKEEVKKINNKLKANKKKKEAEKQAKESDKSKESKPKEKQGEDDGLEDAEGDLVGDTDKGNTSKDEDKKDEKDTKKPKKPKSYNKKIVNSSQLNEKQQSKDLEDLEKMSIFAQNLSKNVRGLLQIRKELSRLGKSTSTLNEVLASLKELNIDTSSNNVNTVIDILKNCR